jgi:hypothetical protein
MPLPKVPPPSPCMAAAKSGARLSQISAAFSMKCARSVKGSAAQSGKAAAAAATARAASSRPQSGTSAQMVPSQGLMSAKVPRPGTHWPPTYMPLIRPVRVMSSISCLL